MASNKYNFIKAWYKTDLYISNLEEEIRYQKPPYNDRISKWVDHHLKLKREDEE